MASKNSADVVLPNSGVVLVRSKPAKDGHLPINEACSDRPAAGSPFGDDLTFPLPVSELSYVHPTPDAPPAHL